MRNIIHDNDDRLYFDDIPVSIENKVLSPKNGDSNLAISHDALIEEENVFELSEQVFLHCNKLSTKLCSSQKELTVAETDFGSGLNFLTTLAFYQSLCLIEESEIATLNYITVVNTVNFSQANNYIEQHINTFPLLATLIEQLASQCQQAAKHKQTIEVSLMDGKVNLTIIYADLSPAFSSLRTKKTGLIDFWYVNRLSSTDKDSLYKAELFQQIARLSKEQASLVTLTVSGHVRSQLEDAGFRLREYTDKHTEQNILYAVFQQSSKFGKGYQLRPKVSKPKHVVIIGGGISSACTAYALTKKGITVDLYCQDNKVAQGASGNHIGALFPLLHQQKDDISLFYEKSFWRARELYDELLNKGFSYAHDWCGLLDIGYKDSIIKRHHQFAEIGAWHHKLVKYINAEKASKKANIPLQHGGLFIPSAGWISPPELVNALLLAAKETGKLTIKTNVKISHITQQKNSQWNLSTQSGSISADTLIICGGADTAHINIVNELPISAVRGQVSNMKANNELSNLSTVICHKGYLTPAYKNQQCIGATFEKNTFNIEAKDAEDEFNLNMLKTCLPDLAKWSKTDISSSKARLRCVTPDHLPMVGFMPKLAEHKTAYSHLAKDKNWRYDTPAPYYKNLYVLSGLGARGLCSAPLLADILTADLTGEPYPVDNKVLFNLAPNRFVIRDLIKRKTS